MVGAMKETLAGVLIAVVAAALCGKPASAQGSRKDDIVFNAQGRPMAGATVRVCTSAATGQPCTPLAQIYSDPGLTQALANPAASDGLGNYTFYAAPGRYEIEISGPNITTKQLPNVILPSDPTAPTFTTVTTTSGISAFALTLSGNLTVSGSAAVTGALTVGGAPVPAATQENQWTASQHFKGPIPWRDVSAYMKDGNGNTVNCSSTDTSGGANTTGTISLGTPTALTLAAAKDFKNGCGIAILGAGPLPTISTPPSTLSISSVSGNGSTITITTTANHNLAIGSGGQPQGIVVSGCTGGSGTFNGTFSIASVADTTHLTYSASGNGTPSSCAATVMFGYAHGTGGSTTYKYQIAAVDGLMGVTAASSTISVTGNATLSKYNYNHLMWACGTANCLNASSPTNGPYMWLVYSDKGLGGALSCIGTAFTNGYSDQGFAYACPAFAPSSPPASAVAEALSTTISSGGGTTTLTLASPATTGVTSANVYHDEQSFLTSCINDVINDQKSPAAQAGSSYGCYIPPGNWWFTTPSGLSTVNPYPNTGELRIRVAGTLQLHVMPLFINSGYKIEGVGGGGGGASFDNGQKVLISLGSGTTGAPAAAVLTGGGTTFTGFAVNYPAQNIIYVNAGGSSEVQLSNLSFQNGVANYGAQIQVENLVGGVTWDHLTLNSQTGGAEQLIDFTISQYAGGTSCCVNISNIFTSGHGIGFRAPGGNSGNCNNNSVSITNWLMENEDPLDNSMIQTDSGPNAPGTACPGVSLISLVGTNIQNADIAASYNNFIGILGTAGNSVSSVSLTGAVGIQNLNVCVNNQTACASGGAISNVSSLGGAQKFGTFSKATDGFAQVHSYGFPQVGPANVSMGPLAITNLAGSNFSTAGLAMMMPAPSSVSVASTGSGSLAAGTYCMGFTGLDNRTVSGSNGETNLSNIVCQAVGASSSITLNGYEGWRNMLFAYSDHNFYYCVVSSGLFCDPNQNLGSSPSEKIATLGFGAGAPWSYTFTSTAGATNTAPPANSQAMLSWLGWDYGVTPYSCFYCTTSHSDQYPVGFGVIPTGNLGVNIFTAMGIKVGATTFSSLASCSSSLEGAMRAVTDSTTSTWGATITGGGANHVLAYCDGTNWTVAAK